MSGSNHRLTEHSFLELDKGQPESFFIERCGLFEATGYSNLESFSSGPLPKAKRGEMWVVGYFAVAHYRNVSTNTYLHLRAYAYRQLGTSSSPLADDGLLQTSTSHDRPKQRLVTIMIFGHKSDLKNHLSAKHTTFSHKVIARGAYDQIPEPMPTRQNEASSERDPPPKPGGSEVGDRQS
jgi:hypothetical protein